jgi:hypothetical protein
MAKQPSFFAIRFFAEGAGVGVVVGTLKWKAGAGCCVLVKNGDGAENTGADAIEVCGKVY